LASKEFFTVVSVVFIWSLTLAGASSMLARLSSILTIWPAISCRSFITVCTEFGAACAGVWDGAGAGGRIGAGGGTGGGAGFLQFLVISPHL